MQTSLGENRNERAEVPKNHTIKEVGATTRTSTPRRLLKELNKLFTPPLPKKQTSRRNSCPLPKVSHGDKHRKEAVSASKCASELKSHYGSHASTRQESTPAVIRRICEKKQLQRKVLQPTSPREKEDVVYKEGKEHLVKSVESISDENLLRNRRAIGKLQPVRPSKDERIVTILDYSGILLQLSVVAAGAFLLFSKILNYIDLGAFPV